MSDRSRSPTGTTVSNAVMAHEGEAAHVMAAPRPIKYVDEMMDVFERHCDHRTHGAFRRDPVRLSFLVRDWEGMDGEFIARIIGDNESSPPGTKNLRFYTPDGSLYCYAHVSTHACKEQQWLLDGRPVHFRIKSFGTYTGSSVNPRNGHIAGDCLEAG